jgi:uncharacterized protein YdeI (YjbR/CyaY-like superfamily)
MKQKRITVFTKNEFRMWLSKNHTKEKKVEVVLYKRHTGKKAPNHRELMEEAICFGWIDTTIKRLDDNKYIRTFTRRNKNSTWSTNTLGYAKQLIKEKNMTPEGLKFYKLGLKKLPHDHDVPKNPTMPDDLKKLLTKNKQLQNNFDAFPSSTKKILYLWIWSAKLPETRKKRLEKVVSMAKQGKKQLHP